jgi:hypothetical protein
MYIITDLVWHQQGVNVNGVADQLRELLENVSADKHLQIFVSSLLHITTTFSRAIDRSNTCKGWSNIALPYDDSRFFVFSSLLTFVTDTPCMPFRQPGIRVGDAKQYNQADERDVDYADPGLETFLDSHDRLHPCSRTFHGFFHSRTGDGRNLSSRTRNAQRHQGF